MGDANSACDKWSPSAPNFGGPFPTRTWSRGSGDVCIGTAESRALAKKIEVLQYKKNSANLTKKQKWAQLAKGTSHNKKKAWATQTQTFTDPNVNNLARIGNNSLERCPPCPVFEVFGDQTVNSQEQADALRGVTRIIGSLTIGGNTVTDFSPFDCLREITHNFIFDNNTITTQLDGFNRLEIVGNNFEISNNTALTTITGFSILRDIGGFLNIHTNSDVESLNGFGSLDNVGAAFIIFNNGSLTEINGFSLLVNVGNAVSISTNTQLAHINGFDSLVNVGEILIITTNTNLINIAGFGNLANVGGDFFISNHQNLINIAGFGNLANVGGDFFINGNTALTNIAFNTAFNNLEKIRKNIGVNANEGAQTWTLPGGWTTTPLNWGQLGRSVFSNNFTLIAQVILNGLPVYTP